MNQVMRSARNVAGVGRRRAGDVGAERLGCSQVPRGVGRRGESEDGRRIEDHRHPVRDERVSVRVAGRAEILHVARHGVGHAVRQVHARVAKSHARI